MTVYKHDIDEGDCPLLNLPCSKGDRKANHCCQRFYGDFDPVANLSDLKILECAASRAKRMHEGVIKYYY